MPGWAAIKAFDDLSLEDRVSGRFTLLKGEATKTTTQQTLNCSPPPLPLIPGWAAIKAFDDLTLEKRVSGRYTLLKAEAMKTTKD
jgi:hypothetical protein